MKTEKGRTTSIWMATAEGPSSSVLTEDVRADVCVVGAGISGLSTAYLLAKEGRKVVVIDDGAIGSGETGRTTAHLSNALDDRFVEIEKYHGERGARLAAESHGAAIDRIETIVQEEKIDCDFERLDGYLFVTPGEKDILDDERDAAQRAGLDVEIVDRAPLGGYDTGRALRFPQQAQFHPLRYVYGLADAITRLGGRIYTGAHAEAFESGPPAVVTTATGRTITADALVVATNSPVNDRLVIHTKQHAYRSYVIGIRVPRESVPRGLYWDTADPYHYVRVQTVVKGRVRHDILIVGGEDHRTGEEDDGQARHDRLEAWTRERFPQAKAVEYRWSGQVLEPVDFLGYIGRNPMDKNHVYVATGDSGHGMTHGTIAGILITDLIAGRENPWATLYDPGRVTLRAAVRFAKENAGVPAHLASLITGGEVASADEIPPGEGAVLRRDGKKIAAYRSADGTLIELSAVCRHLGCIVAWNGTEKSWDCPCHGSRFAPDGHVLNGPARTGLPPADRA